MKNSIIRRVLSRIGKIICRHRGNNLIERFVRLLKNFVGDMENLNWDMSTNGELRVLQIIKTNSPKCAIDVGANTGDWSKYFSEINPDCKIHAFEIVPTTFKELTTNLGKDSNIKLNNIGLSDNAGKLTISYSDQGSSTATACQIEGMKYHDEYYTHNVECEVITGSQYVKENQLSTIDYLKIDVEGMDLKVIKGFGEELSKVKVIQFEYGIFNISSHDLLADFFLYLNDAGFSVGKIFPKRVIFFDYHFSHEDFGGNNFLAVKKEEVKLIENLSS